MATQLDQRSRQHAANGITPPPARRALATHGARLPAAAGSARTSLRPLDQRLDDPSEPLAFFEKWSPLIQIKLLLFFCGCFIALSLLPNTDLGPGGA